MALQQKMLTTIQAAEMIGLRPNTLEIWRIQGKGPVYRKVGHLVRYVEGEVLDWLSAQTRANTSEPPRQSLQS